jgi:predicted O-methyltransferase YrrM
MLLSHCGIVKFVILVMCVSLVRGSKVTRSNYESIEQRFDDLDSFTAAVHQDYKDRKWGIASLHLYNKTKTSFMYNALEKLPDYPPPTVCEVGFNAGHSALLFLETLPTARVLTWDLADLPWALRNAQHFKDLYGKRFTYVPGDSLVTVPAFVAKHPNVLCDVVFIDGSKVPETRHRDMIQFKKISAKGALLFLDEATSFECASGAVLTSHESCSGEYSAYTVLYNTLSKSGFMAVDECVITPTKWDGLCVAHFL